MPISDDAAAENMLLAKLRESEMILLGIKRGDAWISNPGPDAHFENGDYLVIYGELGEMERLAGR